MEARPHRYVGLLPLTLIFTAVFAARLAHQVPGIKPLLSPPILFKRFPGLGCLHQRFGLLSFHPFLEKCGPQCLDSLHGLLNVLLQNSSAASACILLLQSHPSVTRILSPDAIGEKQSAISFALSRTGQRNVKTNMLSLRRLKFAAPRFLFEIENAQQPTH
jgi:hypothetical protein